MSKSVAVIETNRAACNEFAACAERILPGVKAYQLIDDSILAQVNTEGGITPATAPVALEQSAALVERLAAEGDATSS